MHTCINTFGDPVVHACIHEMLIFFGKPIISCWNPVLSRLSVLLAFIKTYYTMQVTLYNAYIMLYIHGRDVSCAIVCLSISLLVRLFVSIFLFFYLSVYLLFMPYTNGAIIMPAWVKGMGAWELMAINSAYHPYEASVVKSSTLNNTWKIVISQTNRTYNNQIFSYCLTSPIL